MRKYLFIINVVFLLGVIGLGFLIVRDERILRTSASEIQTLEEKRRNLASLERSSAEFKKYEADLNSYFVSTDTLTILLDRLKEIASKAEVIYERPDSIANLEVGGKPVLGLSITVEGSFQSVNQYLLLLENSPFKLVFNRVDLGLVAEAEPGLNARWRANFDLILLSFSE